MRLPLPATTLQGTGEIRQLLDSHNATASLHSLKMHKRKQCLPPDRPGGLLLTALRGVLSRVEDGVPTLEPPVLEPLPFELARLETTLG